jgi:hypothetical protein
MGAMNNDASLGRHLSGIDTPACRAAGRRVCGPQWLAGLEDGVISTPFVYENEYE